MGEKGIDCDWAKTTGVFTEETAVLILTLMHFVYFPCLDSLIGYTVSVLKACLLKAQAPTVRERRKEEEKESDDGLGDTS